MAVCVRAHAEYTHTHTHARAHTHHAHTHMYTRGRCLQIPACPKERSEAASNGQKGKIETLLRQTAIPDKFRLKVADISFAYKN